MGSVTHLPTAPTSSLERIVAMIEDCGWSWSVEGYPNGSRCAYVHAGRVTRRTYCAEGVTPELALLAAHRKATCRVLETSTLETA